MPSLTVTAKGQVTLRKEVLSHLGVRPGDKIEIDLLPDHRATMRPRSENKATIDSIFGMLKREGESPMSLEEIKNAIEDGWAGIR